MRTAGIIVSFLVLLAGVVIATVGVMAANAGLSFLGAPRFMLHMVVAFGSPVTMIVVGLILAIVGFFLRLWMHFNVKKKAA